MTSWLRQVLQAVFGGGADVDLPAEFAALVLALKTAVEMAIDTGEATGGGNTTLVDTGKSWETNMWEDATFEVEIAGKGYMGVVVSNTATTLTFAALADAAAVVADCPYGLKRPVDIADISDRAARLLGVVDSLTKWGGTALTGRDISLDLKALIDDGIKGVLKSIGDISTGENLITRVGETDSALVDAGAVGDLSAKIRRLTTDIGALLTSLGATDAALVDAGAVGAVQSKLRRLTTDLDALNTQLTTIIGATDTALVDAGAVGNLSAKLRRLTTDLNTLNTLIGTTDAALVDAGAVGAVSSKLRRLTTDLGALLTSTGATDAALVDAGAVGAIQSKLRRLTTDLDALITAVGLLPQLATTPVIYNVTMTNLDTQYSQALPANTKKYTIQTRDGTAFRLAFETGKVATPTEPYFSIGTDGFHHEDSINPASLTLFFACDEAAKVVEIIAWS